MTTKTQVRTNGPSSPSRDDGVAMIIVLAWSLVVLGLVLVLASSVIRQIVPAERSERSYDALSAAEAGIEDYRARLLVNGVYYSKPDPLNPALGGWAPVPGGNTTAEFTYAVDSSKAGTGGGITLISTGRAGGETRTVKAVLARRSTLDYVYMSDMETTAPYMPGAYSSTADTGGPGRTAQQLADLLCSRHWWDKIPGDDWVGPGATGAGVSGVQRHQNFCQYADITSSENLSGGPIHTNDLFRLSISAPSDIGATRITASCPSNATQQLTVGQGTGGILCPETHRFIDGSGTGKVGTTYVSLKASSTVNGNYMVWNATTKPYQGDTWIPAFPSGTTSSAANPSFDSVLQLPKDPEILMPHASIDGCMFTGPTRIRFAVESGVGVMYVTSPDTRHTNPLCAGGSSTGLAGVAGTVPNPTQRITLDQFTNLVIYVQDVLRADTTDDPDNAYDKDAGQDNVWAIGAEPTCTYKPTRLIAASGSVGSISGSSSPWTATISSMASTQGLAVGSIFTATNGTGGGAGSIGTGGTYVVTAVNSSSVTYTATGGTAPTNGTVTSITRSQTKYPYVTPDPTKDLPSLSGFTTARGNTFGFPSELAPVGSPYFGSNCARGDVFVSGTYRNSVTIAAESNVVITSNLLESTANSSTGKPGACSATYCPMFGLVANQFTYFYRPLVSAASSGTWPADWPSSNANAPKIDSSILAVNQCLSSQREFSSGTSLSALTIWGSIAQKYRCPVGQPGTITGGYTKNYNYDSRLATRTPPYLVELSYEPWKRSAYSEFTPRIQTAASTTWPLATANDATSSFDNLRVAYGPATVTKIGTNQAKVDLTAYPLSEAQSGLVVLAYDVTKNSITEARNLVIEVE